MKQIKYILSAGALTLFSAGCNLIDIVPENALTYENAFETAEEMEATVSTMESILNGICSSSMTFEQIGTFYNGANKEEGGGMGDLGVAALVNHDWLPQFGVGVHHWSGHYALIGYANMVESNMKPSYPQDKADFLLSQAEFAKAYAYYDLARIYGFAAIVPDNDYEAPAVPLSNPDEVLKKAEEYGEKAFARAHKFADLKHTDGSKIKDKQYASKEICATLLAYIYAWHASVTEVTISDADRRVYLEKSEKYASMLIDGELKGYATLEPSINALMEGTLNNRHGKESIFEIELDPTYIVSMPQNALYPANYTYGYPFHHDIKDPERVPKYTISCKRVLDLYGGTDTKDERMEAFFPGTIERYKPESDAEALKVDEKMTVVKIPFGPGGAWGFVTQYQGGFPDEAPNRALPHKFHKEFLFSSNPEQPKSFVNFDTNKIVWRLADLILLRAETRNFLGKTQEAISDLNTIRARAKAEAYPAKVDAGKDLQKCIFEERTRELVYEGHRWWDIRRNKDYYKEYLPAAYRELTQQDLNDGALFAPTLDDAGDYNVLIVPNKYWFSKQN